MNAEGGFLVKKRKRHLGLKITILCFILFMIALCIFNAEGPLVIWRSQESFPVDSQLSDILARTLALLNEKSSYQPYYLTITLDESEEGVSPIVATGAAKCMDGADQYLVYCVTFENGKFNRSIAIGESRTFVGITDSVINDDRYFNENIDRSVEYLHEFLNNPEEPWHHLRMTYNWGRYHLTFLNQSNMKVDKWIDLPS